ncbi:thioredoxin family protein [Corynebacterium canis]|uniref:Thioredoxin n=1 Tax=Corynebacterium canis TaxID=679663 RepID=A0A5C5UAJ7_9CORY|nr:thioredoxin family protein [Corynebacterium canis]TWT22898.1 thioredoxin family protein [Corynebacterium canis]WJY76489.1 Putative thioredoxin-2 [Corynebacterium canis]
MATIDITDETFEGVVSQEGIVLLDCWAPWCGPCRQFGPIYEKVSEAHPDKVFAKLDTEAHQGIAAALQIQSIPTLMIFRDGILVYREPGAIPAQTLEGLITQVAELDMDDVRRQIEEHQKEQQ